jgi:dCMP deaminase
VLLDHRKHVVMTGYNGVPAGHRGCLADACPRGRASFAEIPSGSDYSNCIALHAEENLMIHARREDLDGGTVYVTREPCYRCLPRLEAAGVTRVVWRDGTEASSETLRGDSPVQDAHPR